MGGWRGFLCLERERGCVRVSVYVRRVPSARVSLTVCFALCACVQAAPRRFKGKEIRSYHNKCDVQPRAHCRGFCFGCSFFWSMSRPMKQNETRKKETERKKKLENKGEPLLERQKKPLRVCRRGLLKQRKRESRPPRSPYQCQVGRPRGSRLTTVPGGPPARQPPGAHGSPWSPPPPSPPPRRRPPPSS